MNEPVPHEPTAMVYAGRHAQKHTHHTKYGNRERNHWFNVYKCPVCGQRGARRPQPIVCRGVPLKPRKRR